MRVRLLALLAIMVLGLGACGGHHHKAKATSPASQGSSSPVPGHPCSPSNYYMQCRKNAPLQRGSRQSFSGVYGVDFAWGGPPGSYGWHFAISYLSGTSKDWSLSLLRSYTSRGLPVGFVWETAANRSLDGWSAGYSDAWRAHGEASNLGYPHAHIFFASDFDSSFTNAFLSYYQGAQAYLSRVGASAGGYGGLHTVEVLCAHGIGPNWQTLAWSNGVWATTACSPVRQIAIDIRWNAWSIDDDLALSGYWGQANFTVSPPPPRVVCFGSKAQTTTTCRRIRAEAASWTRARDASRRAYVARGCVALAQRDEWFAGMIKQHPADRRTAARRRALVATRRAERRNACSTFSARVKTFNTLIAATERKYS